jgi:hypothetical protein
MDKTGTVSALTKAKTTKGTTFLKIAVKDEDAKESKFNIFDSALMKTMEQAFNEGKWINYSIGKKEGSDYWNIVNANFVADDLEKKPAPQPEPPVKAPVASKEASCASVAPQAVGMSTKEVGDMIRSGKLSVIFGQPTAEKLVEWYKKEILKNTGIKEDVVVEEAKKLAEQNKDK